MAYLGCQLSHTRAHAGAKLVQGRQALQLLFLSCSRTAARNERLVVCIGWAQVVV